MRNMDQILKERVDFNQCVCVCDGQIFILEKSLAPTERLNRQRIRVELGELKVIVSQK